MFGRLTLRCSCPAFAMLAPAAERARSATGDCWLFCWGSYTRAVQWEWDCRWSGGTPEVGAVVACPRRRAGRLRTGDPSTQRDRIRHPPV
jgi:hypothetical protein